MNIPKRSNLRRSVSFALALSLFSSLLIYSPSAMADLGGGGGGGMTNPTPPAPFSAYFLPNGGSPTSAPVQYSSVPANLNLNIFAWAGHTFVNWNTYADGSGVSYTDGQLFSFSGYITLYAQWTVIPSTFTVSYDGNCANTCGTVPVDNTQYAANHTVNVGAPPSQNKPGYTFGGWSMPGGMGPQIVTSFPIQMNTTLTAVWNAAKTYMVTYMGDQFSTGQPPSDTNHYLLGDPVSLKGPNTLVRTGYSLTGWSDCLPPNTTETNPFAIQGNIDLCPIWTPILPHTATFFSNATGTTGSMSIETSTVPAALTANVFSRPGYTFINWNTDPNGSGIGTPYADQAQYLFGTDVKLYAQWASLPTFTVVYDGNCSNSCGAVPVDTLPYLAQTSVSVGPPPGSTYPGFTFKGWALGSLHIYQYQDHFVISGNTTLTAMWSKDITYTLTYSGNCQNTCGNPPTDGLNPHSSGDIIFVSQTPGTLVNTGFTLTGWKDCATSIPVGNSFPILTDTVLCPIWTANPKFTITYLANGASGNAPPTVNGNGTVLIASNTGGMVKSGNHFSGWNTKADGSGLPYAVNSPYNLIANLTLHAVWIPTKNIYKITYDGNCSNTCGTPPSPTVGAGSVQLAGNTGPMIKTANHFGGWNTNQGGTGTTYPTGNSFNLTIDVTLYALWIPDTFKVIYRNTGYTFGTEPSDGGNPYLPGALVTVVTGAGTLVKTGYTFAGWSDCATHIALSGTFTIVADTFLCPLWNIKKTVFTLHYDGNSFSSGSTPNDVQGSGVIPVDGNTGVLTKVGNTFGGWNTSLNGTGTHYAPQGAYNLAIDATLYAEWVPQANYTITYDGNVNSTGTAPGSVSGSGLVTLANNSGLLTKVGNTFGGWNTASDGSGSAYPINSPYNLYANIKLFAVWIPVGVTFQVTYDGNGSSTGTIPNPTIGSGSVTLDGNSGHFTRGGYAFGGWNTKADGSGLSFAAPSPYNLTATIIMYAVWVPNSVSYAITYKGNGYTGGTVPNPTTGLGPVTLDGNSGLLSKLGYTFGGWNTRSDGSGTPYPAPSNYGLYADINMYAVWVPVTSNNNNFVYTITYSGNTNSGGIAPQPTIGVGSVTLATNGGALAKSGNTFGGWNTSSNGTGSAYPTGGHYNLVADVILFAVWNPANILYTITYSSNGSSSGTVPSPTVGSGSVTLASNSGILVRSGYPFGGWNTKADNSGVSYSVGSGYTLSADITLYAIWNKFVTYAITYDPNGSTGGSAPSPTIGSGSVTLATNSGSLVKSGSNYSNWNTAANGNGTPYSIGSDYNLTANVTLYAIFITVADQQAPDLIANGKIVATAPQKKIALNQIVPVHQQFSTILPTNAIGFQLYENGKFITSGETSTKSLQQIVGPKDQVSVVSVGKDGSFSAPAQVGLSKEPISLANINFDTDSYKFIGPATKILDQVAAVIIQHGYRVLEIWGYVDTQGSKASWITLSNNRAKAVKDYMTKKLKGTGVEIRNAGRAQTQAVGNNNTEEGRALNRRVEIRVS